MISENIYGHRKRLHWIVSHINKSDTIVEFGCGTGYMISLPLAKMGYNIVGIDTDEESIAFGQEIFRKEGLDPNVLKAMDISELNFVPDVVIASEVLEHISDEELDKTLYFIRSKLVRGGRLFVTVPNGYGWFEMESFLWFKARLGILLKWLQITRAIKGLKHLFFGLDSKIPYYKYPSTLSGSAHVRRFTYWSIQRLLQSHGFEISDIAGSVLFAGELSDLLFTGIKPLMKFNCLLGNLFPVLASGFYVFSRSNN